jgi:ribonuclease HI
MVVHFDGACQPPGSNGVAGWGFTVEGPGYRYEDCGLATRPFSPHSTNNVAEYVGAIRALEHLRTVGFAGDVLVEGDSELIIRQMNGEYEVRAEHLKAYFEWLRTLAGSFRKVEFRWIPREENVAADELSKRAIANAWDDARRHRRASRDPEADANDRATGDARPR